MKGEIYIIDIQNYCDNVASELTVWKGKIYDIVRKIDKVSSGDKAKIGSQVNDLHIFIEELENRIDRLRRECPTDWKTDEIEMKNVFDHLKGKYNDIYANVSPGDMGG